MQQDVPRLLKVYDGGWNVICSHRAGVAAAESMTPNRKKKKKKKAKLIKKDDSVLGNRQHWTSSSQHSNSTKDFSVRLLQICYWVLQEFIPAYKNYLQQLFKKILNRDSYCKK